MAKKTCLEANWTSMNRIRMELHRIPHRFRGRTRSRAWTEMHVRGWTSASRHAPSNRCSDSRDGGWSLRCRAPKALGSSPCQQVSPSHCLPQNTTATASPPYQLTHSPSWSTSLLLDHWTQATKPTRVGPSAHKQQSRREESCRTRAPKSGQETHSRPRLDVLHVQTFPLHSNLSPSFASVSYNLSSKIPPFAPVVRNPDCGVL